MNLEETVLETLREKPQSGGRLIERLQAGETGLLKGRAVLVYAALANLRARGEADVVATGPGEQIWGEPGAAPEPPAPPGCPPSFALPAGELALVDREVSRLTKGLAGHYFEELRRVVVADADRRVFHGDRLPRAVVRALDELGPAPGVRRLLRRVERPGPVPLKLDGLRLRWLKVPLLILFVIVAIRLFVLGVYTVPPESISMAPTLMPAAEHGDGWVLVNLLAYGLGRPARGDVVVFRLPPRREVLVKRVMGLPGETIGISGGDLFVDGKRLVKERPLLDRVKVPLLGREALERTENGWRQARDVHAGFLDVAGQPEHRPGLCRDVVVTARVRGAEGGSVTFLLDDGRPPVPTLLLRQGGGSVSAGGIEVARGPRLALRPGAEQQVWFTNADGVLRVEIDGVEVARAPLPRAGKRAPRLTLVIEGDVGLEGIEVARDLIHESYEGTERLGEDEYFVLGDNSPESRDSRHFRAVPGDAFMGRVFAVAWPLSRVRWIR